MRYTLLVLFSLITSLSFAQERVIITAPAENEYSQINVNGKTVLPNGRFITPAGKCWFTAPHPYGLAVSIDGTTAVTANSGTSPISITILRELTSGNPQIRQIPPSTDSDKGVLESVFMGLAVSPDNSTVYVAGGQANRIYLFDVKTGEGKGFIDCSSKSDDADYTHGYIGDLVITADGRYLYAVDQIGFRMVVADLAKGRVIANCPTGRYPFGIALSKDEKTVFVANVGMYEYGYIQKKTGGVWKRTVAARPPFAYNTPESEKGIQTDSLLVPGLGPVNSDEAFSVWAVDVNKPSKPLVISRIKTGYLIGQPVEGIPAVGGSSPNSIVAAGDYIFISNGTNDNITVLDSRSREIVKHIKLQPVDAVAAWRGVIPFGLAVSPDEKQVFVAEAGINAIGVIDVESLSVKGHIPAGWFPSKLKVTPDGKKLIIANAKGFGSGPNGGSKFVAGPEGSYIGNLMKGTVQVLDIPGSDQLALYTKQVIENNFRKRKSDDQSLAERSDNPVPLFPSEKASSIRYIVFISKENRTYDEVFGQVKDARGDSIIARYGRGVSFKNRSGSMVIENATVMPNHLKLAQEFSLSDNFYVDADVSADGHRWLANTYPNEWVEATTPANYGGNRDYRENSTAPGNLGINGAAGAIYPEDYNEAGSMWDHLFRNNISYYNFGFGVMFEPADYQDTYKYGGIRHVANFPMPASLHERTSYTYPTYNMAIPDQFRVDMFIKEFNERWGGGTEPLPSVLTVIIPNDHGADERPEAGYPFRESYMADNDLAVGRIVEFLSHTPYWKNMLIVITEDDAQGGVDHVDAHRSILMAVSPYVKRNHISHTHTSFGSIFKTFWNILGIPCLNQYDAAANDMGDMFTASPDFTPYAAVPVDLRIFDPQKALDPLDEKFNWDALKESPEIDKIEDMKRESKEQEKWRK